jgi:hypothetical protein
MLLIAERLSLVAEMRQFACEHVKTSAVPRRHGLGGMFRLLAPLGVVGFLAESARMIRRR